MNCAPFEIAFSAVCCSIWTSVHLLIDFRAHEPLFFVFLALGIAVLLAEFEEVILTKVFGESLAVKVKEYISSSIFSIRRTANRALLLKKSQHKWTIVWITFGVSGVLLVLSSIMDDAELIYAACLFFSSTPIWKRLLGKSSEKFVVKAGELFKPHPNESMELAEFMPDVSQISQDLSIRLRRNSNDSQATERDLETSAFAEEHLPNLESLDNSTHSILSDSYLFQLTPRSIGKATDEDEYSPIASDVEIIDASDIPDDLTLSGTRAERGGGDADDEGTLRRSARIRAKHTKRTAE